MVQINVKILVLIIRMQALQCITMLHCNENVYWFRKRIATTICELTL